MKKLNRRPYRVLTQEEFEREVLRMFPSVTLERDTVTGEKCFKGLVFYPHGVPASNNEQTKQNTGPQEQLP